MRWLVCVLLVACGGENKPSGDKKGSAVPREASIASVAIDALPPDAAITATSPEPDEVAVTGGGGVSAFYIDKLEATSDEYKACIAAKACRPTNRLFENKQGIAMGGLTFYDAQAFCRWRGKRLPTPAEWKRAAYGDDKRPFPWGTEPIDCERAWFKDCSHGNGQTKPGGRAKGASAFGAEDMIGNVAEWTDPGPQWFVKACIDKPRTHVPMFGGGEYDDAKSPLFVRDPSISDTAMAIDNPDHGVRCARSEAPPPVMPPVDDAILRAAETEGQKWIVEPVKLATTAFTIVNERCKRGEQVTVIDGRHTGDEGWFVVTGVGRMVDPPAKVIVPPHKFVRVVGIASCGGLTDRNLLTVDLEGTKIKLEVPDTVYQVWLPPGFDATFSTDCKPARTTKGECSLGTSMAEPVKFHVPDKPKSGIPGPILESDGGWVCD